MIIGRGWRTVRPGGLEDGGKSRKIFKNLDNLRLFASKKGIFKTMKLNWAERWVVNNPIRTAQQRWEIRWIKDRQALDPGNVSLEVGCGKGAGIRFIQREFRPSVFHALDLDMRMIRKAREYLSQNERESISMYVGDVFRLPYRSGVLDAVFGFGVLHHVPDWQAALREIVRVLKPGGFYLFEEIYPSLYQNFLTKRILLHPTENRFCSRDLKDALRNARLHLKDTLEFKKVGIIGVSIKEKGDGGAI